MEFKQLIDFVNEKDSSINTVGYGELNWNGSNVDVRVFCPCGEHRWLFGEYVKYYKCSCGKKYALGNTFNLIELEDDLSSVVDKHGVWK